MAAAVLIAAVASFLGVAADRQNAVAGGDHTANYRDCIERKEASSKLAKQAPVRDRKSASRATLPLRQLSRMAVMQNRWT